MLKKVKYINIRFYGEGNKKKSEVTSQTVTNLGSGLFSDIKKREDLLAYWAKQNEEKKNTPIQDFLIQGEQEKERVEQIQQQKVNIDVQEKKLPKTVELLIKSGINNSVEIQNEKPEEKNLLIETALEVATVLYKSQGWLGLVFSFGKILITNPNIVKSISVKKGIKDWANYIMRPYNWIANKFGWTRITFGTFGSVEALELVDLLNKKGTTIIPLDNGHNYLLNLNISEHILSQVNNLSQSGINVTTAMMENMILQGGGILLSKNTLEPLLIGLDLDSKEKYLSLNEIFSDNIATNLYNLENIPSFLQNPIDAITKINNYSETIINASGSNDSYSILSMILVVVLFAGSLFLGKKAIDYINKDSLNNNLDIIPIKKEEVSFIEKMDLYKNNIIAISSLLGLGGSLFGFNKLRNSKKDEKKVVNEDDSDLC